jgi:hypothetical protein
MASWDRLDLISPGEGSLDENPKRGTRDKRVAVRPGEPITVTADPAAQNPYPRNGSGVATKANPASCPKMLSSQAGRYRLPGSAPSASGHNPAAS